MVQLLIQVIRLICLMMFCVRGLLVPEVAPWCKLAESMNYIERAQPEVVLPVHNAILSEMGGAIYNNWLGNAAEKAGSKFAPLKVGETIEIL